MELVKENPECLKNGVEYLIRYHLVVNMACFILQHCVEFISLSG